MTRSRLALIHDVELPTGLLCDMQQLFFNVSRNKLRQEIGYRAGRVEKLLDFYSHPGYIAHKVHLFATYDLEWEPLELDDQEVIRLLTFGIDEALELMKKDYCCDSEAALALWLYVGYSNRGNN